jgi:hypothetical protein
MDGLTRGRAKEGCLIGTAIGGKKVDGGRFIRNGL